MKDKRLKFISKIVDRAEEKDLVAFDRISLEMDLELADQKFNLRLDELLKADNFNFSHDIIGIQKNIDRINKTFVNHFVPRYAGKK